MSIHVLPTELLVLIGECCEPHDAYSLALCCRELHNALKKILSKHRKVWCYWNNIETKVARTPSYKKLLKLARKPHLALYIETFKCESEYEEPGAYSEFEMAELMQHFETFATTQGLILNEFRDENWRQDYLIGLGRFNMRTLSTYLIYMSANLRRLECIGDTVGENDLLMLLVNVGRASTTIMGIPTRMPLQYLRSLEVKLDLNIDEGGLPADWLIACMYLPCLKTFTACRMSGVVEHFNLEDVPSSLITNAVLQASTFAPDTSIQMLSRMINLKSFAYQIGQDSLAYEGGLFSPKKIITALVKYAGHSLEHLTIHGQDEDTRMLIQVGEELPYVLLAGFKRLKTLRCSTYLLTSDPQFPLPNVPLDPGWDLMSCASEEYKKVVEEYKSDDFLQPTPGTLRCLAFATRLPQFLKALHLDEYLCHTPLAYYALSEFVQKTDGLLLHLKQLYLSEWGHDYLEKKGLLGIVEQKGLKYKKLPDPFRVGSTVRGNSDSESEFKGISEEEEEA